MRIKITSSPNVCIKLRVIKVRVIKVTIPISLEHLNYSEGSGPKNDHCAAPHVPVPSGGPAYLAIKLIDSAYAIDGSFTRATIH